MHRRNFIKAATLMGLEIEPSKKGSSTDLAAPKWRENSVPRWRIQRVAAMTWPSAVAAASTSATASKLWLVGIAPRSDAPPNAIAPCWRKLRRLM